MSTANAAPRQPSEQATEAAIDSATRLLRLPTLRERDGSSPTLPRASTCPAGPSSPSCCWPSAMTAAPAEPPAESTGPDSPGPKTLENFGHSANPAINPAVINTLAGGTWIAKGHRYA